MSIPAESLPIGVASERAPNGRGWSSTSAFVLAAAGSAVGLGNVWKFPYIAGEYGGGAFVLVYLVCVVVIGLPILMAEIALGRRGGHSPIHAFGRLSAQEGHSKHWRMIGWMGLVGTLLLLSFYSVVAGWSLSYLWYALSGQLFAIAADAVSPAEHMSNLFDGLLADPIELILGHSLIMALTIAVVGKGVRGGLERAVRGMVPGLLILLVGLVGYAAVATDQFAAAATFLFQPDFSALTGHAVLVALGHAFFSLSVGMTAMMAYGSYLDQKASVAGASVAIAGVDTVVALLAGLAIFPIVFAHGLAPGSGPGLLFVTLPIAFSEVSGGAIVAALFFLFLAMAALTSTISVLEPITEYLEQRFHRSRAMATGMAGTMIWALGLGSVFSFNLTKEVQWFGLNFFDLLDFVTSHVLLPLGGLLIALYAGRILSKEALTSELNMGDGYLFKTWRILLRYVCPPSVGIILIYNLL